jgi:hypothetical protein
MEESQRNRFDGTPIPFNGLFCGKQMLYLAITVGEQPEILPPVALPVDRIFDSGIVVALSGNSSQEKHGHLGIRAVTFDRRPAKPNSLWPCLSPTLSFRNGLDLPS